MEYIETIEVEFPGVLKDGKYYSLDLTRIIETPTYKKIFVKPDLSYLLIYGNRIKDLCPAEIWIIRNLPKYDYLWKKETITL